MRNPGAASYDQMWTRMEKQDRKISTLEANFRVVGNGFDALSNAITREGSMLNFRPAEQAAVDRARLLRSGEDDPTS